MFEHFVTADGAKTQLDVPFTESPALRGPNDRRENTRKIRSPSIIEQSFNEVSQEKATPQTPEYIPAVPNPLNISSPVNTGNAKSQSPLMIIGGFNAFVFPIDGMTPNNIANMFQTAQQLGGAIPNNPIPSQG